MAKLKIKNFGPIKNGYSQNNGYLEITPVTVICGNQATGKSTIAKLYSSFVWLEKKLDSGELTKTTTKAFFINLLAYHKIDSYLKKETEIEYIGDSFSFFYSDSIKLKITSNKNAFYIRPKVVYIPAERNFCTSLSQVSSIKGLAKDIFDFLSDYMIAASSLKKSTYKLPLNGYEYRYDEKTNTSYVGDRKEGYEIDITNASSGLQSLSPMALTSGFYSQLIDNKDSENNVFSFDQEKRWKDGINKISNQYNITENSIQFLSEALKIYKDKTQGIVKIETEQEKKVYEWFIRVINSRLVNVVEEPEQNLYPKSQSEILFYLLQCFNAQSYNTTERIENQLLITTHSPYILSYLTLSAKASELIEKGVPAKEIAKFIPIDSVVNGNKISIYETKSDGSIQLLEPYENLPSDENELNKLLEASNEDFSNLLDLEAEFCK